MRGGHPVLGNVQHVVRPVDGQADGLPRPTLRLDDLVDADKLRGELVPGLRNRGPTGGGIIMSSLCMYID